MHNPQSLTEMRELLAQHGLEPKKALGQHFLADPNIVMKIVRTSGVGPGDQVLEVGPGTGTLTAALGSTGAAVTAYEVDQSLEPILTDVLAELPNVEVVFKDATTLENGEMPGEGDWVMVANLPYNVGTPLVLSLLRTAPQIKRFVVMIQKEVADRFVAAPGSKAYGLPSVIVGMFCGRTDSFFVPPQVFFPPPNVGSAVVTLDRATAPPLAEEAIAIAAVAFGKRRKMIRSSLKALFADVTAACEAAGVAPTARPEELSPEDFCRLAAVAAQPSVPVRSAQAHPKLNLSLEVFGADESQMHPLRSVVQTLGISEKLSATPAANDSVVLGSSFGAGLVPLTQDNLVLKAVRALRATGATVPALKFTLDKCLPIAAGIGAGSADAAAALLLCAEFGEVSEQQLQAAAVAVGADVPAVLQGGTLLMEGYGEQLTQLDFVDGYALLVAVPDVLLSTPEVYSKWDELGGPRGEERPTEALPAPLRALGPFRNDLEPAAVALVPELTEYRTTLEERFGATFFFSGSGPTMFAFLPEDHGIEIAETDASQLGLRELLITTPHRNGASLNHR